MGHFFQKIHKNDSGLALVEFAVSLPFFMGLTVGGIEVANFASVTMQLNQIAIHTADNAARMGSTTALAAKRVAEMQVNDVFEGTLREGDRVALVMPNVAAFVISYYGILKAGGVVAATNPTYPADKMQFQINDCDAPIVITMSLFYNTIKQIQPKKN